MIAIRATAAFALLLSFFAVAVHEASGQTAAAQDRAAMDQTLQQAARISGQTADQSWTLATDEDSQLLETEFGTQRLHPVRPKPQEWLIALEAGGFITSNAVLAPFDEQTDWVGRSALRAAWSPQLTPTVFGLVAANYGIWRYADLDFLGFDDVGAQAGLVWKSDAPPLAGSLPPFSAWAQYRYNRLVRPWEWQALLYETHFFETGLRKAWGLSPDIAVWLGGNAAFSVDGQPRLFRRHEFSLQAGAIWQITPQLAASLLWRGARFHHVSDPRRDWNHLLFAGLSWRVRPLLRVDLYWDGTNNDSNIGIFDYSVTNGGVNFAVSKGW